MYSDLGWHDGSTYLGLLLKMAREQPSLYLEDPSAWLLMGVRSRKDIAPAEDKNHTHKVSTEQTVRFNDSESVDSIIRDGFIPIDRSIASAVTDIRMHEIRQFLARPMIIQDGQWLTSHVVNTELCAVSFPDVLVNATMYKDKLQRFLGIKGSVVIRVQLNAHRFAQGRLMLNYIPQAALQLDRAAMANSDMVLRSQTPHVDIDPSTSPDVTIKMPYVSPLAFTDLYNGKGPWGTFWLSVYSPLLSPGGSSSISWTMWAHLEDVELFAPTVPYGNFVAQGLGPRRVATGTSAMNRKNVDVSEEEAANAGEFRLSSAIAKFGSMAGEFAKVPLLSGIAGPTSWVAQRLANTAASFGFSNPKATDPPCRMLIDNFAYSNNVDAIDTSKSMGLSCNANIQHLPGFAGTDIDEMALAHVVQVRAYAGPIGWNASNNPGDRLWWANVWPAAAFTTQSYTVSLTTQHARCYTPMGYVAQAFNYWRGSIEFVFKFVKTEFHTGRLMFVFAPGVSTASALDTATNRAGLYREILDIAQSNEFCVRVPYIASKPWLNKDENNGAVGLYVVNDLVAPSTVSPNISIICEQCGGPDMEFAFPRNLPSNEGPIMPFRTSYSIPSYTFTAQGLGPGEVEETSHGQVHDVSPLVGGMKVTEDVVAATRYCVGECITSIRQLIKRSTPWQVRQNVSTTTTTITLMRPQAIELPGWDKTGGAFVNSSAEIDYLNFFGPMYAYRRGGTRHKFYFTSKPGSSTNPGMLGNIRIGLAAATGAWNYAVNNAATLCSSGLLSMVANSIPVNGGVQVEVPAYCKTPLCYNFVSNDVVAPEGQDVYYGDSKVLVMSNGGGLTDPIILRQAADDYSFGFFIGVPLYCYDGNYSSTVW